MDVSSFVLRVGLKQRKATSSMSCMYGDSETQASN